MANLNAAKVSKMQNALGWAMKPDAFADVDTFAKRCCDGADKDRIKAAARELGVPATVVDGKNTKDDLARAMWDKIHTGARAKAGATPKPTKPIKPDQLEEFKKEMKKEVKKEVKKLTNNEVDDLATKLAASKLVKVKQEAK